MKLSLAPLAVLTLFGAGCYEVHEGGFDTSLGFQPIALGGIENNRFDVCVDGADQPHARIYVINLTFAPIEVGFVTTGRLKTTSIDNTVRPNSILEVRTELLGPIPKDTKSVGTVTVVDIRSNARLGGPYVGEVAVDVRVLEIGPLEWAADGTPTVVLTNPTPFPAKVHLASVGRWFDKEKETELPPKATTKKTLAIAGPAILPRRLAAEITIEGSHCSKADLLELPKIEIPSEPPSAPASKKRSLADPNE